MYRIRSSGLPPLSSHQGRFFTTPPGEKHRFRFLFCKSYSLFHDGHLDDIGDASLLIVSFRGLSPPVGSIVNKTDGHAALIIIPTTDSYH